MKSHLAVAYQKLLIHKCDKVFANSYFTQMVNNDFYKIESDAVFHLGVTNEFYNMVCQNSDITKKKHTVLFVGRLNKAKGIHKLVKAIKILVKRNVDCEMYIVGDGKEKKTVQEYVNEHRLPVTFLDRLDQKSLSRFYQEAEVFVSLDASEPFGIVFLEALLCGCKIVCPITGGQNEYLSAYTDSVAYVDPKSVEGIALGIDKMFVKGKAPVLNKQEREQYTYKSVAQRMIRYLKETI